MRSQLTQASRRAEAAAPRLLRVSSICGACAALALVGSGCNDTGLSGPTKPTADAVSPVNPDDVPITEAEVPVPASYAEAVERLAGYRDAIRQAVESGQYGKAHRPLDETNITIERLPDIARSSDMPRRHWEQVVTASEDLGEALDQIHTQIDAGGKADYAPHAEAIDDAIARLQAIGGTKGNHSSTE